MTTAFITEELPDGCRKIVHGDGGTVVIEELEDRRKQRRDLRRRILEATEELAAFDAGSPAEVIDDGE